MMRCGLLGRSLSHSYSPGIHEMLGSYSYGLFEKEPEALPEFLTSGDWDCINVTVPYKKDVIPFLDALTDVAARLGAVNTIVKRNGKRIGHNTDYFGFLTMVRHCGLAVSEKKALVCGSGGASSTAVAVLEDLGARVVVLSRTGHDSYENLHRHADAALLVNTTPVGMYPENGTSLIDLDLLPNLEGVLDVIYNPARTKLILDAQDRGLATENGLLMLVAQAKEAAQWFTGSRIDDSVIDIIYRTMRRRMENIILIGMPGCGKSTIGKALSARLGREFADADTATEAIAGISIPDIFSIFGEDTFRRWEIRALSQLGKQSGLVIATGGGCVTKPENAPLLRQNGTVFWIKRNLSDLPTDGRPLSQSGRLEEMYRIREPLYTRFADHIIDNNGSVEDAVKQILEAIR